MLRHVSQERLHALHFSTSSASVDERVVGNDGKLHVLCHHLVVDIPDTSEAFLVAEALEDRAIDDRVDKRLGDLIRGDLLEELVASLDVVVGHEGFYHTAQGDARWLDMTSLHLAPSRPNTAQVLDGAVGPDQAAVSVGALDLHRLWPLLATKLLVEEISATSADAGFAHGAEQDLIHVIIDVVQEGHRAIHIGSGRRSLKTLQKNGTCHLVRLEAAALHLADERPICLALQ
mmetsp:Transcript_61849/g.109849  ORF Transcript_61849/g.109849 Transcript_61849/m.109849 type:complete len:232 (+) Transcript_61849:791-1486(+)